MTRAITRREFVRHASTAGAFAAAATMTSQTTVSAQRRPNILFICTDDQAPWALGRSGNSDAYTPNLNRLFGEGAYLARSFAVTPVCSPSRASTMTSRYGTEVGITDWINHRLDDEAVLGLDAGFPTWTEILHDSGYATGLIGKWHLGTAPKYHPTKRGFEYYAGFLTGGTSPKDPELEIDGEMKAHQGLTVDILTDYAIEYLRQDHRGRPFALNVHFRSPHAPYLPVADEDMARFDDEEIDIPNPTLPGLDADRVDRLMREYLANVAGIDRNVGRILDTLEAIGEAENTVVVFTSDHGYNVGQHGILHKGNARWILTKFRDVRGVDESSARPNMFDTSLLVPTCIRWPGVVAAGTVVDKTQTNLDWFPTFLEMAGVAIPAGLPIRGKSIVPLLRGEAGIWNNDFYGEYSQHHYVQTHLRMYRTEEWKLIRDFKRPGYGELYDLVNDPTESTNMIAESELQHIVDRLDEMIRSHMRELGDPLLESL
jgi:uncharacterized sulfatase